MVNAPIRYKSRLLVDILILVMVITIIFGIYYYLGAFEKKTFSPHTITYKVSGNSSVAVVTYTREDGSTTEAEETSIPWQLTIKANKSLVVVLTAGNPTQTGTIECSLMLDGREWKSEKAVAPADKVSCAGIVP